MIAGVGTRMLHQLREGLAYVWTNRPIFYQMALAAVTNGFGYQYLVLVPLFAKNVLHGDARTYGFLVAIQGLGSVVGAVDAGLARVDARDEEQSAGRAFSLRDWNRGLRDVALDSHSRSPRSS